MSTSNVPRWVFDTSDPDKRGLVKAFGDATPQPAERFIRFGGFEKLIRIVRNTGNEDNPHEDIVLTGAVITLAAGPLDAFPTGGNSNGEYNNDATGLDAIPAGATALQMQMALNANPGIFGEGGVTVELERGAYRIEWANVGGPRGDLEWFGGSLTPPPRVSVRTIIEGDIDTREVKVIEIHQDYWAANSVWVAESSGSIARTVLTQGSSTEREVVKILITGNPTGGKFRLTTSQAAIHAINTVSNYDASQSAFAQWEITSFVITNPTISENDLSGLYFDIFDSTGTVRVWFDVNNASAAPVAPTGGRLLEIDLVNPTPGAYATAAVQIDIQIAQTVHADAEFNGSFLPDTWTRIRAAIGGKRPEPDGGTALGKGLIIELQNTGSSGRLDGTYFWIYDSEGKVGIWFNLSGFTEMPDAVALMSRSIEIGGIAYNATSTTVANTINTALDNDASFGSIVSGSKITVTDVLGGSRLPPSNATSPIGVIQTKAGYTVSASMPFDCTASQLRDAANNIYSVTMTQGPDTKEFVLTAVNVGDLTDLTVTDLSLVFPKYYRGTLSFNTATMFHAFLDAGTADEITGKLEGQYQFPGEDPVKFYQAPLTVNRSLIDTTALNPVNPLGGELREGAAAIPIGQDFADVVFSSAMSTANYTIMQGYVENIVDNPPPDLISVMTYAIKTTAGFRVYFTGPPSNANSVFKYIARLA